MPLSYRERRQLAGNPIVDDRKRPGDRHKNKSRKRKTQPVKSKWERREVIAWDGEGYDIEPGKHVYNLLANSLGSHVLNMDGLSTESCFEFFLSNNHPRAINVIFGGSYDVNMILGDLPRANIERLWTHGSTTWKNYKIIYKHRKKFTLYRFTMDGRDVKKENFILWDVLGYFQSTFVIACRKWLGDLEILDTIELMKTARSTFEAKDIEAIRNYCYTECKLLVSLVEALFEAMDEGEIFLDRYDGAGSIAAALFRKYDIKQHAGDPPKEVKRWAQYAYSGGWIEAMKLGNQEGLPIHRADINSAYPSEMLMLPSYAEATWAIEKEWNGLSSSLVHVKWNFDYAPFYPLFYREPDGSILHPKTGEGIFFGCEISNLERYHKGQYEIIEAYNVCLSNVDKPFAFNKEVYQLRMMYKSFGSMASEALKLGMNSEYGKCAQQAGYRNGRVPTYHHLLWAGETTARVRAKLYRAAMQKPKAIIAFATDAIISTEKLDLPYGTGLGEWTPEEFSGITIVQPGVYFLRGEPTEDNPTGWYDKYRGFDKGALLRLGIVEAWKQGSVSYSAHLTRFVTMGSALNRKPEDFLKYWRTWAEREERKLDIRPVGKRVPGQSTLYHLGLCDTIAAPNMHGDLLSAPYPLVWITEDQPLRPLVDGVDMKIIEQEYEESYA